jgi:hypothetical protein
MRNDGTQLSPSLAQHVCSGEHNPCDERKHAGKQHNIDENLGHCTAPHTASFMRLNIQCIMLQTQRT